MNPKYAKQFQGKSKQNPGNKNDDKTEKKPEKIAIKPLINRTTSK